MRSFIFIAIVFLVFLGIDFYVFQAIKLVSQNLSTQTKKMVYSGYWILSILILIGVGIYLAGYHQAFPKTVRSIFGGLLATILLTKLFIVVFLLIDDLQRLIRLIIQKIKLAADDKPLSVGAPISRSEFLIKAGLIISAIPFISMASGIFHGIHNYQVKRVKLSIKNLPDSFVGKKIAQISDIHSGSFFSRSGVKKGVDMLMKQKADMIFFTGDLVNDRASEILDYIELFKNIKAPLGVFSILGNHDYGDYVREWTASHRKENRERMKAAHKEMGWDLLLNENRTIKIGNDELAIIGVENWGRGERWPKYGDLSKAYKGIEDKPVKLLLSHDPSHWESVVLKDFPDINATFSGHTHGFQFGIRTQDVQWSPVQYVYDQWAGLYKYANQYLYVNVGFGFIGFPGRVGMPPEITVFELEKA